MARLVPRHPRGSLLTPRARGRCDLRPQDRTAAGSLERHGFGPAPCTPPDGCRRCPAPVRRVLPESTKRCATPACELVARSDTNPGRLDVYERRVREAGAAPPLRFTPAEVADTVAPAADRSGHRDNARRHTRGHHRHRSGGRCRCRRREAADHERGRSPSNLASRGRHRASGHDHLQLPLLSTRHRPAGSHRRLRLGRFHDVRSMPTRRGRGMSSR